NSRFRNSPKVSLPGINYLQAPLPGKRIRKPRKIALTENCSLRRRLERLILIHNRFELLWSRSCRGRRPETMKTRHVVTNLFVTRSNVPNKFATTWLFSEEKI